MTSKADVSQMLEIAQQLDSEFVEHAASAVESAAVDLASAIARELGVISHGFDVQETVWGGALASFGPAEPGAPWPELLREADPSADWD
ncbi:hypothetical protein [Marinimicrobium sp. ABcell2]|uniref:hypothetical protein n=1 Tax=Marinimicrobium sp. ABcell2 TaxID=3069751 RepID=UPI0027B70086|nr:hypothetical protein [Marinimicrobium sp. ABcell2]MDQ2077510.1 hypothetical protein [Marinimicrobium sp. ABcell2]